MTRRIVVVCLIMLGLALALRFAHGASAHEVLVRSEPADGAELLNPPRNVQLWFSDPLSEQATVISVIDSHGQVISATTHVQPGQGDSSAGALLRVELPTLPPGLYAVNWQVASRVDLHQTNGTIVFGVQQPVPTSIVAPEAMPMVGEVVVRWLDLIGLCGIIGALVTAYLFGTNDSLLAIACRRRALEVGFVAALMTIGTGVILLVIPFFMTKISLLQLLFETSYGPLLIIREIILFGFVSCLIILLSGFQHNLSTRRFAWILVVLIALIQALRGHAAAFPEISYVRVIAQALHLLAAATWGGAVPVIALVVVPLLWQSDTAPLAWHALQRFGRLAGIAIAILAITGLYSAGQQIASLDALLITRYGQLLLAKALVSFLICCVGFANAATIHPWLKTQLRCLPLRWNSFIQAKLYRRIRIEGALLLLLALPIALLSVSQPARGARFTQPTTATAPQLPAAALVDDLLVNMNIQPSRAGMNFITIDALNTRRPVPAPIEAVRVALVPPEPGPALVFEAVPTFAERYQVAGAELPHAGDWRAMVTIRRTGMPDTVSMMPWHIQPAPLAIQPTLISNQPLAPILNDLLVGLAIVSGATLGIVAIRYGGIRFLFNFHQQHMKEPIK